MAARLGLPTHDHLHNVVASPAWDGDTLGAVLVVDDTALPKTGADSVSVAHQYAGALGKNANC